MSSRNRSAETIHRAVPAVVNEIGNIDAREVLRRIRIGHADNSSDLPIAVLNPGLSNANRVIECSVAPRRRVDCRLVHVLRDRPVILAAIGRNRRLRDS